MKYLYSVLFILSFLMQGVSQNINFNLADPQPVIHELYGGAILSGDLDNDGDMDLIQSGIGENLTGQGARASVFLNDGLGNFTLEEQNFNQFWTTERMALDDLDNDGDLDLVITSANRTDFYRNDGQAQFTFDDSADFQPSDAGELIIGDVDGDGDNDLLHFGELSFTNPFAQLHINDGSGNFTLSQNASFIPLLLARIQFIDLEGDGDLDIICFGKENDEQKAHLYENDGAGNYSIFMNSNIAPHFAEEITVGDIDNDGDEDVFISGNSTAGFQKTILYLNNGSGQFSELTDSPFPDVGAGGNAFADLDNDDDLDILLIGSLAGGIPNIFSIIYENHGNNNFVPSDSLGGEYIAKNTIADFNGDGKRDIIIQGFVDNTSIYWNETVISSTKEITNIPISVFPNPTPGQLQMEWKAGIFNEMEIINQQGGLIFRSTIAEQQISNTVALDVPAGIYILKMSGPEAVSIQRIVITR